MVWVGMARVYHFSDEGGIEVFVPRAPLAHPDAGAFVYAIDEWHSPFYFFPRECPRIGIWPVEGTLATDLRWFEAETDKRLLLMIDRGWEELWRGCRLFRYSFDQKGFLDTGDHGCWVSPETQVPLGIEELWNLPQLCDEAGVEVRVVEDLVGFGVEWAEVLRGGSACFRGSLHVSMTRMRNLTGWPLGAGRPVHPKD